MMIWHRQLDYIKLCYGFTNLDVFMFLFTIRCKGFYLYYAQNNINNNKADFLMIHMRSETVE